MPTIRTPDGRRLRIPDDATPEQIQAVLASLATSAPTGGPPAAPAGAPPSPPAAPGGPGQGGAGVAAATPPPTGVPTAPTDEELFQQDQERMVSQMTPTEKVLAGMGKSVDGSIRGVRQIWNQATGDEEDLAKLEQDENEARRNDRALMDSGWGKTGNIAGHIMQFAVPGGLAARGIKAAKLGLPSAMAAEGAIGGLMGGITPTAGGESRASNAVTGAVTGAVLPGVAGAARTVGATPSALLRADVLRSIVPTGLKSVANVVSGLTGNTVSRSKIGQQISQVSNKARVPVQPLVKDVDKILARYGNTIPREIRQRVGQLQQMAQTKAAKLKGEVLQDNASELFSEAAQRGGVAAAGLRRLARTFQSHLDDSLPAPARRELKALRTSYRTGINRTEPSAPRVYIQSMINALRADRPPNEEEQE